VSAFFETLAGLYELTRLGLITRFRFRGPYWAWRMHTAFGRGRPSTIALIRGVVEYGRWVHRMRRGSRGL
jgi:hypothetical protein